MGAIGLKLKCCLTGLHSFLHFGVWFLLFPTFQRLFTYLISWPLSSVSKALLLFSDQWAAVYGVTQTQTQLKRLSSTSSSSSRLQLIQYSCLENPMDGGAWWAAVPGVAKSRTRLSDFTFPFHLHALEKEMATHSSVLAWRIPGTGAWWAAIYGVAQSWTRLKRLSSSSRLQLKKKRSSAFKNT